MIPGFIVPGLPTASEIRIKSFYEVYRQVREVQQPEFVIENIRFTHDPEWRTRVMSIQSAHDGNGVWALGRPLMILAGFAAYPFVW